METVNLTASDGAQSCVRIGIITAVDYTNDTADVEIEGLGPKEAVPIIYNCNSEGDNATGGSVAFSIDDEVLVLNYEGKESFTIIAFADGLPRLCGEYLLIKLSGDINFPWSVSTEKFIVWNISTNSLAIIPGITFPCEESDLIAWKQTVNKKSSSDCVWNEYDDSKIPDVSKTVEIWQPVVAGNSYWRQTIYYPQTAPFTIENVTDYIKETVGVTGGYYILEDHDWNYPIDRYYISNKDSYRGAINIAFTEVWYRKDTGSSPPGTGNNEYNISTTDEIITFFNTSYANSSSLSKSWGQSSSPPDLEVDRLSMQNESFKTYILNSKYILHLLVFDLVHTVPDSHTTEGLAQIKNYSSSVDIYSGTVNNAGMSEAILNLHASVLTSIDTLIEEQHYSVTSYFKYKNIQISADLYS